MERRVLVHNPNNPVTVSVERITGPFDRKPLAALVSQAGGADSVVVKTLTPAGAVIVPHWVAGHDTDHWNLWNREVFAYTTGVVDSFVDAGAVREFTEGFERGLRAPKLLASLDGGDGSVSLILENVKGRTGAELTLEDHARIAAGLGEAQGRLCEANGEPQAWTDLPWLSRSWVRKYATTRIPGPGVYQNVQAWEHPVVIEGFGSKRHEIRRRFGELYQGSGRWFSLLESLPQTLCHLDFWPNNAIAAKDGSDVLIDWSFVGRGAVGEDPGNWIPDTIFDHFMEPSELEAVESAVWSSYRSGLERSGWDLPIDLARLGMLASAVKYIWLPGLMVERADHSGPTAYGAQEGFDLAEVFARRLPVFMRLLDWIDKADSLASKLGSDWVGE
ncbi:MAG: phosphotransferase [Microthrixaceae bacterium]